MIAVGVQRTQGLGTRHVYATRQRRAGQLLQVWLCEALVM